MKLFVRGGVGLIATLFAAFLIFYARPLIAETYPSQQPAQEGQQDKQALAQATQDKKQTEPTKTSQSEMASISGTVLPSSSDTSTNSTEIPVTPAAAPQIYSATSYSLRGRGASGLGVRKGTIAADPKVLPYGTRVYLDAGPYTGEYLVTDCGTAIKGRKIDVWVPTYREACRFGRRNVKLTVLSYGARKTRKK